MRTEKEINEMYVEDVKKLIEEMSKCYTDDGEPDPIIFDVDEIRIYDDLYIGEIHPDGKIFIKGDFERVENVDDLHNYLSPNHLSKDDKEYLDAILDYFDI